VIRGAGSSLRAAIGVAALTLVALTATTAQGMVVRTAVRYRPVVRTAAVVGTVAVTAAVVGSAVRTLPPSCSSVVVGGVAYQQCGSSWYRPQYAGSEVTYTVVHPPH
jgi:hypothetical protein